MSHTRKGSQSVGDPEVILSGQGSTTDWTIGDLLVMAEDVGEPATEEMDDAEDAQGNGDAQVNGDDQAEEEPGSALG